MQLRSSTLLVQATVKAKGCAESTARSWLVIYGRGCEGRGEDQYCSEATCEPQSNVQLTTKNVCELKAAKPEAEVALQVGVIRQVVDKE